MRRWLSALGPFAKGVTGAVVGTVLVLVIVHLVSLYLSLLQIVKFINVYGPKIQALP